MRTFILILLISFTSALAQVNQNRGFIYNISPLTIDQKTGETDYVFSAILLTYNIASTADLVFTKRAIATGKVYEGNPIVREFIHNEPLDWIMRFAVIGTVNYILKEVYQIEEDKTSPYVAAIIISGSCSWLAYRNYQMVLRIEVM